MDFESPDVMKDFPGLYSTESGKKNNDSDYSDDSNDKVTKKELLIGKRKDKKDNKKDRGYAALEGESSAEEDCETKSPSKTKKTKSFKFSSKSKEKDKKDKKIEKEKDVDKKKENRKTEKNKEKVKCDKKERKVKHLNDDKNNIEDVLPIFGVTLQEAVARSRCHDGVDLPLPIRECIDYLEIHGKTFENIYKVNGIKSKVLHIKKLYNQREIVNLEDYDVPTVTSVFKMFFRELPEPILGEALTRFEEAGAVQNVSTREANLISLIEKLPIENKTILAWTILHLDYITFNEKHTKMNAQGIAMTLSPVLQMSHRLLAALLCHCKSLFKDTIVFRYCPPLSMSSTVQLPEDCDAIQDELRKQESLLAQIHYEMNSGFISKKREELLWEVQRMITQLKRNLRSIQKCNDASKTTPKEDHSGESSKMTKSLSCSDDDTFQQKNNKPIKLQVDDGSEATTSNNSAHYESAKIDNTSESDTENLVSSNNQKNSDSENQDSLEQKLCADIEITTNNQIQNNQSEIVVNTISQSSNNANLNQNQSQPTLTVPQNVTTVASNHVSDSTLITLQHQNQLLNELKDSLVSQIAAEKSEIIYLKYCAANNQQSGSSSDNNHYITDQDKLEEIMDLLTKENRILKIKKIDLVREIMENREACIALKTKLFMSSGVR